MINFPYPLVAPQMGDVGNGLDNLDIGFLQEKSDVIITNPLKSSCGRFEVDPQEEYGLSPDNVKDLAAINKQVRQAAEDAVNAGCISLQDHLGVTDGGFAGVFFSGSGMEELRIIFAQYAAAEVNFARDDK